MLNLKTFSIPLPILKRFEDEYYLRKFLDQIQDNFHLAHPFVILLKIYQSHVEFERKKVYLHFLLVLAH